MTSKIQREPEAARGAGGAGFASRVTREELGTGAVLLVLENAATPTVSVRGSLRAGSYFEPRDRPGLARLTAEMLKRGTRRRGKLELAGALEQVGASVEFDADVFAVQISARALSEDFPALASTLAEMLREPSFPAEELEKLKQQTVAAIQEQQSDTRWRAYERLSQTVFDEENPFFVHAAARLVESVGSITVADVLANRALGESTLSSRLGLQVRDAEGLTYGIASRFRAPTLAAGPWYIAVSVNPGNVERALESAMRVLREYVREGIRPDELEDEKASAIGSFKVSLSTNAGLAAALWNAEFYRLGLDYVERYPELVRAVTVEEVN